MRVIGFPESGAAIILAHPNPLREKSMRLVAIIALAALLAIPATGSSSYAAPKTDISAAKKKKAKKTKAKKEEYLRAVPVR